MDKYIYISDRRIRKGNRVVSEDNLCLLDDISLKKSIENKIIKKQKTPKNHGSKSENDIEGSSEGII